MAASGDGGESALEQMQDDTAAVAPRVDGLEKAVEAEESESSQVRVSIVRDTNGFTFRWFHIPVRSA